MIAHPLHILRHSPAAHSTFNCWLRTVSPGQGLLLIEDAVYSLLPDTRAADALGLLPASVTLYAIGDDLLARGLALDELPQRVQIIDYAGMVALCSTHTRVISW